MKLIFIFVSLIVLSIMPSVAASPFIQQGGNVYVNDTIDISGVAPPYPYLAYWNGYDMYDANASYVIELSPYKSTYYHFYLDPSIFSTRTGKWYKYNGKYESNSNNIAFVVHPQTMKNSTMRYSNGTLVNISETIINNYEEMEIPIQPPVEIKHVSDYLVARGDPLNIKINTTTKTWVFGRVDKLLELKSTNESYMNIQGNILSKFEPGRYVIELQTIGNKTSDFTLKYDTTSQEIKWFNETSFTVEKLNIVGLSSQVLFEKFNNIIPFTLDTFTTYKLELQEPYIEIYSISERITPNETVDYAGTVEYNTNVSFIEVKGYTNVAIGSILKFVIDEKQQTSRTLKYHTTTGVAGGSKDPGDMRWFDVIVPVDKYNLAAGDHTLTAYTNYSTSGAVYTFTIYMTPKNSYVPPKTIRYISGKYGAEEFVPTPTPVIQTVTVTVPGPTQIVEVEVTPSDEQVKRQQEKVFNESVKKWLYIILTVGSIIIIVWYLVSLYLRRKYLND